MKLYFLLFTMLLLIPLDSFCQNFTVDKSIFLASASLTKSDVSIRSIIPNDTDSLLFCFDLSTSKPKEYRGNKRTAGILGAVALGLIFSSPFVKNKNPELSKGLLYSGVLIAVPLSIYFGSRKKVFIKDH